MTRDQFDKALDRYGGDLTRWPSELRHEAEALTAADAGAAAGLRAAQRLDTLVAKVTAPAPADAALIGRIVAKDRPRRDERVLRPTRRLAGWVTAGLAATLIIGFMAGALTPPDESNDTVAALLFSATDEDFSGDLL